MSDSADDMILLLSQGTVQKPIVRLMGRFFFGGLITIGFCAVVGSRIVEQNSTDGLIFGLLLIVWSLLAFRVASRMVTTLQLRRTGVYIETLTSAHFISISYIQEITVKKSKPYWNMVHKLSIFKSSERKRVRFSLLPLYYVEIAPIDFPATIERVIDEFSSKLNKGTHQNLKFIEDNQVHVSGSKPTMSQLPNRGPAPNTHVPPPLTRG